MLHLNKGSILIAEEIFNDILASSPSYGHAAAQLGFMRHYEGSIEAAKLFFDKALDNLPDDEMGFFHRGLIQTKTRDYEEAEKSFLKVLELNPLRFDAILNYAGVIGRMGDFGKAEKIITEAYRKDENLKNGFAWLGWIKAENDDWAGAIKIMNRDYKEGRVDPWWVVNIAMMFGRVGDWNEAVTLIKKAYELDNFLKDGFAKLGWIKAESRDWKGALHLMVKDYKMNRISLGWIHNLVTMQVFTGDHLGAVDFIDEWYKSNRSAFDGYSRLGWSHYHATGKTHILKKFIKKDIKLNRVSIEGKLIKSWAMCLDGDLESSKENMSTIYNENLIINDGFAVMGWLLIRMDDFGSGLELLDYDYRKSRISNIWKVNYSYQLLKNKQIEKAISLFNEVVKEEPNKNKFRIGFQILPEKIMSKNDFEIKFKI